MMTMRPRTDFLATLNPNQRAAAAVSGDDKQVEQYAARAVELLRQAVAKGYKDAAHMKKDTDLDPLRSHPEFQKLLKELEAKGKTEGK